MSSTQKRLAVEGGVALSDSEKKLLAFEKRLEAVEAHLKGVRGEERWSLAEIQEIIDRTDLTTDMDNLPLTEIAGHLANWEERLDLAEGNISNLQRSHRSHTNYDSIEFANMHGYNLERLVEIVRKISGVVNSQPASKHVVPDALKPLGKMILHAMRFADEMSYLIRTDEDGEATVTAQALVTVLVELAGLKLEVG